jgi:hydrogenase nickel incorporation protein HypB
VLALNLVSSPGSGKTTLLERTIRDLKGDLPMFVVEGDQETANDATRIRAAGAPVVQVNTGTGCHLEADMVARGLAELKPPPGAVVMIENVGNLVCPALFDLGERAKVVILSVTEGEDKPLKYPHMFRAAEIMILNKIDLLPHVDFDVPRAIANALQVNPKITVLRLSARTGEGLEAWYRWLRREAAAAREAALI